MEEAKNYVVEGFRVIGQDIRVFCEKNKTHILTGLSVAGTVATGVLSARSGARAARKIDRREEELGRRMSFMEKAKLCGKDFIAPAAAGVLAAGSAIGSDVISTKIIGERTALLIASEQAYERLSRKTKEVVGEKKAHQVTDEIAKEKVAEARKAGYLTTNSFENAPRSGNGTLYPFVDGYSMLPFWSNLDYILLTVRNLNDMMRDMAPRGDELDYSDKMIGIPYSMWLREMNFDKNVWDTPERKTTGWNKGYAKDGIDDDPIEYITTTMEWEPGFAVTVVNWEKDPTNMRLGRLLKANQM